MSTPDTSAGAPATDVTPFALRAHRPPGARPLADPLKTPEILRLVLERVAEGRNGRNTICSAVRVNKLWFGQGIELIWREPTTPAFLYPGAERINFYASLVTKLNIQINDGNRAMWSLRRHLSALVDDSVVPIEEALDGFDGALLRTLANHSPNLRSVRMESPVLTTDNVFIDFVEKAKSLRNVYIGHENTHLFEDDGMAALAVITKPGIEYLMLVPVLTNTMVQNMVANPACHDLFPSIQTLVLYFESSIPRNIFSNPTNTIKNLCVSINTSQLITTETFESIGQVTSLSTLKIFVSRTAHLAFDALRPLSNLGNLTSLTIIIHPRTPTFPQTHPVLAVDDASFYQAISKLVNLHYLELGVFTPHLTAYALSSLSNCPHLEHLRLVSRINNVEAWRHLPSPMFPQLRTLDFARDVIGDQPEYMVLHSKSLVPMFFIHCPKLVQFGPAQSRCAILVRRKLFQISEKRKYRKEKREKAKEQDVFFLGATCLGL